MPLICYIQFFFFIIEYRICHKCLIGRISIFKCVHLSLIQSMNGSNSQVPLLQQRRNLLMTSLFLFQHQTRCPRSSIQQVRVPQLGHKNYHTSIKHTMLLMPPVVKPLKHCAPDQIRYVIRFSPSILDGIMYNLLVDKMRLLSCY